MVSSNKPVAVHVTIQNSREYRRLRFGTGSELVLVVMMPCHPLIDLLFLLQGCFHRGEPESQTNEKKLETPARMADRLLERWAA